MNSEADELLLLERAFLRIGSAESDDQFENLISKLLGPVIFKIPSNHIAVRNKAIELLTHINKRIKCRPTVQVPVVSLLQLYCQAKNDQFVKNFLIIYIKMGYGRMPAAKQLECLPLLVECISDPKTTQQLENSFLCLFLRGCQHFVNETTAKQFLSLNNILVWNKLDVILELLYDALLTPYSLNEYSNTNRIPPGMSSLSLKKIIFDGKIDDLHQIKLGILCILQNCDLAPQRIYIHFISASLDANVDVSTVAKKYLKNEQTLLEWQGDDLRPLYTLFVGDSLNVPEDKRRQPADLRMKIALLPLLQKMHVVVSCLQEEKNSKIRISGLNFGMAALQRAQIHSFKEVSPNFLSILTEILWKKDTDETIRILIYRLSGNVIIMNPELVKSYKEIFPKFIEDLTEERNPEVRSTIKESLMKMAESFRQTEIPETLMHFLANRILSPVASVKEIVLHYLAVVFPNNHIKSRFLLAWATADNDPAIQSYAERKLSCNLSLEVADCEQSPSKFPIFSDMLNFVFKGMVQNDELLDRFLFGDQNFILTNKCYIKLLLYIRNCMLYSCDSSLVGLKLEHPGIHTPKISSFFIRQYNDDPTSVENYVALIRLIICKTPDVEALQCLLECVGSIPKELSPTLYNDESFLSKILYQWNKEVNYLAASLYGIVLCFAGISHPEMIRKFDEFSSVLKSTASDNNVVLTALWSIASFAQRNGFKQINIPESLINNIVMQFSSSSVTILSAACYCIGQIGRRNELPLPLGTISSTANAGGEANGIQIENKTKEFRNDGIKDLCQTLTKLCVTEKLLEMIRIHKTNHKVKKNAAEALGMLCIGEYDFPYRKLIIDTIIAEENENREVAYLMDLGHVISDCIMATCSIRSIDEWFENENDFNIPNSWDSEKSKQLFLHTFHQISNELIHPLTSKSKLAAAVWLLILMKNCVKMPLQMNELSIIQPVFLELMLQNDDLIHDAATRGLSFIPKFTTPENSTILAKQLTDNISLIQKRKNVGSVLIMYKEFSYLVSSLKNYTLIYHFLNLINQQNQSQDEKYYYEFKTHEKESVSELLPYSTKMVHSLYVYRFHPSSKIKRAMNVIWSSLFPDVIKTIQIHSESILKNCVSELICSVSELRISYCLALEDLLRLEGSKLIENNEQLMPTLLTNLYKLMDDIYEQVRRTAYGTTKMYLHAFAQNILKAKSKATESKLLNEILPILLTVGVPSTVKDIRNLSVSTLLTIIDHLGSQIKPHLPTLIPCMIESAVEVEVALRYVEQRSGIEFSEGSNDMVMSEHFSSEIIHRCVAQVDEQVLEALLPRLLELLKENTSFSTRNSAINFVVLLSRNMAVPKLQPFVGKIMGALFTSLSNSHKNIRKNSASAIGYLSKFAKDSSIDNLLTKLVQLFMKNMEDESIKSAVGQTLLTLGSQSQDAVQARAEKVVPVIFFAMHLKKTADGCNDQYIDLWKEVWNDVVGSMEVSVSRHREAILQFLKETYSSPSWSVKTQSARALSVFVTNCPDDLCDNSTMQLLIGDLISTLNGKFWHGKEEVVEAVIPIYSSQKAISQDLHTELLLSVLKECGRGNLSYQATVLETLGKLLIASNPLPNLFTEIYDKLKSIIVSNSENDRYSEDVNMEDDVELINQRIKLRETAFIVLGHAWPNDVATQNKYQEEVVSTLTACLFRSTRLIQISIMVSIKYIINKLALLKKLLYSKEEEDSLKNLMCNVEKSLGYALDSQKHTLLKKEALHVMIDLVEIFHEYHNRTYVTRMHRIFSEKSSLLANDADPIVVLQISQLKDLIKRTAQ